jgi:hypothetical protein
MKALTVKHVLPPVVALLLVLLPHRTRAFADYLLTGSGCWTELGSEEVIMNHAVVDAEHVEGGNLGLSVEGHQTVVGSTDSNNQQVVVSSFPQTVHIKVEGIAGSTIIKDYQYVIDVIDPETPPEEKDAAAGPFAAFDKGSCTDRRRVSGRANDNRRTLVVHRAGAKIVAGWATGHEAVKLTKAITFVSSLEGGGSVPEAPINAENASLSNNNKEPDWTSALLESCPEVVEAAQVGAFPVVRSPAKLHAVKAERENEVQLKWLADAPKPQRLVLVSSSTDATFQGGVCGGLSAPEHSGPRLALAVNSTTDEIAIPVLSIHKPHTIRVYAYTYDGTSHSIQRTEPFVLTWVPDRVDSRQKEKEEAASANNNNKKKDDPQRLVDAKARADPHQIRQQAHAYLGKVRTGSGSGKVPPGRSADDRDASNDERRRHKHHLSQEESVVDDNAASLDQHPGHRRDGILANQLDHDPQQNRDEPDKRKLQGHRRGFHHALLHRDATLKNDGQPLRFTVGPSYYAGVAILIGAPIAVVQLCLRASRKAKGRRTL